MKKLNLLFIIPTFNPGGAERQMIYLLKNINRENFNLSLILFKKGTFFEKSIPDYVKVFYMPNYKNVFKTVKGIRKIIKKEKIKIVQSFLPTANYYGALSVIGNKRIKFLASSRSVYSRREERLKYLLMNHFSFRVANIVIGNSKTVANDIIGFFKINKNKVKIIYNGIDIESYKSKKAYCLKKTLKILFVGRFVPNKGLKELKEIVKRLSFKDKVSFLFVGDGPLKKSFKNEILNISDQNNVEILDSVSNINDLYVKSDILIFPTHWEGFPNVVMEAMLSGLPVVTTDISANRELIKNGKNGFLVKIDNIKGFIDKILLLLEKEELRKKIGEKAREAIINNFSLKKMVSEYENLYKELINEFFNKKI